MSGAPQLTFAEFWPYYLAAHSRPAPRWLHLAATLVWLGLLGTALLTRAWWLCWLIPPAAYGLAWFSHFFLERNRPATFRHPLPSPPPAPAGPPPPAAAPAKPPLAGRARLVDDEVAAQEVLAVQAVNGLLGLLVVGDLDEPEAAGLAGGAG